MILIYSFWYLADYYEDTKKHPSLLSLDKAGLLNYLMYSIHARNNIGIHDRSPFSVILYTIIRDKAYDLDNLNSVFKQIAELDLIKPHEKFLVILPNPENFALVLNLMIKRANNIDELTEDYIYTGSIRCFLNLLSISIYQHLKYHIKLATF